RWILSDLALLACEAVNVPLPPSFTPEQIAHVLEDAGIEWLLTDQAERFMREHPAFAYVGSSHRTGLALLQREGRLHRVSSYPVDIAKVTYTSGSTSAPNGVYWKHRAIQSMTESLVTMTAGLGIQTHLCLLPLATPLETIAGVYAPLTMGAKVVARPRHTLGV